MCISSLICVRQVLYNREFLIVQAVSVKYMQFFIYIYNNEIDAFYSVFTVRK
jgi:hypothetical protein